MFRVGAGDYEASSSSSEAVMVVQCVLETLACLL